MIRGTPKIWDSSLANIGLLYAKQHGALRAYHDRAFESFWQRQLDIEDLSVLSALLTECGTDGAAFPAYARQQGRRQLLQMQLEAEDYGVFGVPSFVLDEGSLYWGREHLPRIKQLLRMKS